MTTPLRLQGLSGIGFTQSLQRPVRPEGPVRCRKCSWPAIVTALAAPSPPPCHLKDSGNRRTDLGWRAHSEPPVPRSARPPHSLPQECLAGHRHGACRPQPATLPSERFRIQSGKLGVACTMSFAEPGDDPVQYAHAAVGNRSSRWPATGTRKLNFVEICRFVGQRCCWCTCADICIGTCLKTRISGSPKTASFAGVSLRSEQLEDCLGGLY